MRRFWHRTNLAEHSSAINTRGNAAAVLRQVRGEFFAGEKKFFWSGKKFFCSGAADFWWWRGEVSAAVFHNSSFHPLTLDKKKWYNMCRFMA